MTRPVAVITGASRGIGAATAVAFADRGCDVALWGRSVESLAATEQQVIAKGGRAVAISCDVADTDRVQQAAVATLAELGTPTFVINNAGIVERTGDVDETDVASWDRVISTNLRGPFLVTRALLPSMKKAGRGRLLFVASISSTIGCAGNASYAASKWGVVGLAKSIAEELRGTGLIAASLLPGSVDTDMLKGSGFEPAMTAAQIADMLAYLAFDAPDAIQGSAVEMFGNR